MTHTPPPTPPPERNPTGTLVLMMVFLAALAGFWLLIYRMLLER